MIHLQLRPGEPTACGQSRTWRVYITADESLVTCTACRYALHMREQKRAANAAALPQSDTDA